MLKNSNLSKAKAEKNDEFYTRLEDIEAELSHYPVEYFKDKVIYCPTDVAVNEGRVPQSQFVRYFQINAHRLQFKKLIATCLVYKAAGETDEDLEKVHNCYILERREVTKQQKLAWSHTPMNMVVEEIDYSEYDEYFEHCPEDMQYVSGDYRSDYCQKLFKEADVVVTNPPFSLFRDFVATLEKYQLKYVIVGNQNAITYKEIFPLIRDSKLWLGVGFKGNVGFFSSPYDDTAKASTHMEGHIRVSGAAWFTNMDFSNRHEELLLVKPYEANIYEKYDNYDAINVDKTKDIPCDYAGLMGVPITFLYKYNPDQFEIIGLLQSSTDEQAGTPNLRYYNDFKEMRQDMTYTGANGGKANGNPVLKGKSDKGNFLYNPITDEYVHSVYARIVIRRKQQEVQ